MRFSALTLKRLLVSSLREFFASEGVPEQFRYSSELNESKIEISSINDFHKINLQVKPRIMLDRGVYTVSSSGLNDGLYESQGHMNNLGATNRTNTSFITGNSSFVIDSRQEGTCELLTDIIAHFLVWSRPFVCNALGLRSFGNPISISPCSPMREETEIFRCAVSFQYIADEYWINTRDSVILKDVFQKVIQAGSN